MLCPGLPLVRGRAQTYLPEEVDWITQPESQPASTEIVPPELPPFVVPPRHLFDAVTNRQQVCRLVCDTLLPELARRLQHGDPLIRRRSAACLAKMGPAAAGFAQSLLAALHDDDAVVRRHASIAIGNGRVASAQSHFERLRFDDDRRVAQTAIDALDRLRPAAAAGELGSSA